MYHSLALSYIILLIYLYIVFVHQGLGGREPKKLISVVCHWHTIPDIIYWYVLRRKCFCWPEYYLFFVITFFITASSSWTQYHLTCLAKNRRNHTESAIFMSSISICIYPCKCTFTLLAYSALMLFFADRHGQ